MWTWMMVAMFILTALANLVNAHNRTANTHDQVELSLIIFGISLGVVIMAAIYGNAMVCTVLLRDKRLTDHAEWGHALGVTRGIWWRHWTSDVLRKPTPTWGELCDFRFECNSNCHQKWIHRLILNVELQNFQDVFWYKLYSCSKLYKI